MTALLDVNLLLAYGWSHHPDHASASSWIEQLDEFALCPLTELGFVRVSMSSAFRASHDDALKILAYMRSRIAVEEIPCDLTPSLMPRVTAYKDTTDAYLVALAKAHSRRLATLDDRLVKKPWAKDVAYNPVADKAEQASGDQL